MSTATLHKLTKKTLEPQLRFPEYNFGWESKAINSITEYVDYRGKTPTKTEDGIFLVTAKNIKFGYIDYESSKEFISKEDYDEVMSRGLPKIGDVLITTEAPLGNIANVDNEDIALAQRVIKYRGLSDICDNYFLKQYFLSNNFQKVLFEKATGGTVKGIKGSVLHKIKINIPSLPEQQKIASFLSAVDDKTQQLSRKKELLSQYKKGVMQQLFSGKLRFKDENGKDYADWEEKKLGEVAEKRIIKNKDNKINLVFTNSAVQGIVNQRDFFDKDIANQNNLLGYYIVEKNDFVYNPRISTYAPVGPISRNYLNTGIMSPLYSVFRFKEGNLDFIECFFNSTIWHIHMKNISNYGARDDRMSFSTGDFYKMSIPFPCLEEQQKIANFLSGIDNKIEMVNQQLTQTQTFKKGLLQQMFV